MSFRSIFPFSWLVRNKDNVQSDLEFRNFPKFCSWLQCLSGKCLGSFVGNLILSTTGNYRTDHRNQHSQIVKHFNNYVIQWWLHIIIRTFHVKVEPKNSLNCLFLHQRLAHCTFITRKVSIGLTSTNLKNRVYHHHKTLSSQWWWLL